MVMRHLNLRQARLLSNLVQYTGRENLVRPNRLPICLRTSNRTISSSPWMMQGLLTQASNPTSATQGLARTPEQVLTGLVEDAVSTVQNVQIPNEATVLASLGTCEDLARSVVESAPLPGTKVNGNVTPAANLLFLDEQDEALEGALSSLPRLAPSQKIKSIEMLSSAAESIVVNPAVFITSKILQAYINIQALLGKPETLGKVVQLYSNKPFPTPGTDPIRYTRPNPNKISSAIPIAIANSALTVAIDAKDLSACLDIIKNTVCTTAFIRNKIFQRTVIPVLGLSLAPVAAYILASQLSDYQHSMSTEMATRVAFAGILAYIGFTTTIGVVAVTTANDQMDRVTWATGMPLRERWLREEERAMLDRVAVGWGFKESSKRGEEEGQYWKDLREWIGLRGMVLDRVSLMEGME